ncbi:hypothetical protein E9993_08965 [Labilibacter sediminis]|nr:hypothetical protein E9993_08965 [Labilibacter sediminis]
MNIIFLHRSTGLNVYLGNTNPYVHKLFNKSDFASYFKKLNKQNNTNHNFEEQSFPGTTEYGYKNYPYDYYNIWVKNGGDQPYKGAPTLEMLTKKYDVVIFKHCYSVSNIVKGNGQADVNSEEKTIENYKLQFEALKNKMHEFPDTKFIVWTPAVRHESSLSLEEAQNTKRFYEWMLNEWNEEGDNIYLWDFYKYETEGGLFLKDEFSSENGDSHPNKAFSAKMTPIFADFVYKVTNSK